MNSASFLATIALFANAGSGVAAGAPYPPPPSGATERAVANHARLRAQTDSGPVPRFTKPHGTTPSVPETGTGPHIQMGPLKSRTGQPGYPLPGQSSALKPVQTHRATQWNPAFLQNDRFQLREQQKPKGSAAARWQLPVDSTGSRPPARLSIDGSSISSGRKAGEINGTQMKRRP